MPKCQQPWALRALRQTPGMKNVRAIRKQKAHLLGGLSRGESSSRPMRGRPRTRSSSRSLKDGPPASQEKKHLRQGKYILCLIRYLPGSPQVSLAARRLSRGLQYIEVLDVYRLTADAQLENLNLRIAVEYLSRRQKLCQEPKAPKS